MIPVKKSSLLLVAGSISTLLLGLLARPIQDDYSTLNGISKLGYLGYLQYMWQSHGGNLTSVFINSLANTSFGSHLSFLGLTFYFLTTVLVILIVAFSFAQIYPITQKKVMTLSIFAVAVFSFEGLFSPGFLGAFFFSSASATHLVPVLAALSFSVPIKNSLSSIRFAPYLALGFIAGNSNIAEGLAVLALGVVITIRKKYMSSHLDKRIITAILGGLIGVTLTVAAPGFANRADQAGSLDGSLSTLIKNIIESLGVHVVDLLARPGWVLAIMLGVFLQKKYGPTNVVDSKEIRLYLYTFSTLLFLSLTIGSAFSYSAWHQTIGLNFVFSISCFLFALNSPNLNQMASRNNFQAAFVVCVILTSLIHFRAIYLVAERAISWDKDFQHNVCLLAKNSKAEIYGPEIIYKPFQLGITDVQSWQWMKDEYASWVVGRIQEGKFYCNAGSVNGGSHGQE